MLPYPIQLNHKHKSTTNLNFSTPAHHRHRPAQLRQVDPRKATPRLPRRAHSRDILRLAIFHPKIQTPPNIRPNPIHIPNRLRPLPRKTPRTRPLRQRIRKRCPRRPLRRRQARALPTGYRHPRRAELHQGVAVPAILRGQEHAHPERSATNRLFCRHGKKRQRSTTS